MKPMILCIMDGVGMRNEEYGNAVLAAHTPNLDKLFNYPHCLLEASEAAVGLPKGQMGNSEVGHMNIGTGRIIKQGIDVIKNSIDDGSLKENIVLKELVNHVKKNNSNLHICGLLSDGGIHSHIDHLMGLIDILKEENISMYFHIFTDGRDTKPDVSLDYINELEEKIKKINGKIATISGRYYAMDRDNRWDRTSKAYFEMTNITDTYSSPKELISKNYKEGITDEFIVPGTITNEIIKENDGILVFNFRADRLRQLFSAFTNPNFDGFERTFIPNLKLVTMMPVDDSVICQNLFKHGKIENSLGEVLENNNLKQLRIAETEKYAHVTYFFDGEGDLNFNNCDRILVPSPKVATYDLKPEMSAYEITNKLVETIRNYDVIILNYANGDMVGHTGNLKAAIKAVETVDECLGILEKKITELNGTLIVTADHGNCDYMLDEEGNVVTSHSLSKVPFIINKKDIELKDGKLSDIAPTMLYMLGINVPKEMTGDILITNFLEK